LQNGANAVPASTRTEVEQATCTVAQLLSMSEGSNLQGPISLANVDLRCWCGGEECPGVLCSSQLELRRVKRGAAG